MADQHGTNGTALYLPAHLVEAQSADMAVSEQEQRQIANTLTFLQERLVELETALDGWDRLEGEGQTEFSLAFLKKIRVLSRLMFLKNPLIKRSVTLQIDYVFGQGINVAARHPDVNVVVQAFMDDRRNKAELTSHEALKLKEQTLAVDGDLFFVLFTNRVTGRVRVRTISVDEIDDIVTNPEDAREAWYYRRVWAQRSLDVQSGRTSMEIRTAYYPDWHYQPKAKLATIGGHPVQWDAPVYHVKVGGLDGMRFGVPETYAAQDWATAYKAFLEDWATITRAYARFAWQMKTPGGSRAVQAAKTRLSTTLGVDNRLEQNPPAVTGATFIAGTPGTEMAPIRTAGATTSSSDGEHIKLMVAAAFGIPSTFYGDANVGNHATAKTLDRPTELKMANRQMLWSDIHQGILQYVVDQSALATRGKLKGAYAPIEPGDDADPVVVLANDPQTGQPTDRYISIDFPPILEHDQASAVAAIVEAATLGGKSPLTFSPKLVTRLLLQALGIEDIDEVLDTLFPEPPEGEPDPNAEPPNKDELSPSSSQAPKPTPAPSAPSAPQPPSDGQQPPATVLADQQQQQPSKEAATTPGVTAVDLGSPLALNDAALGTLAQVGEDDLAGAERMWREANAGEPTADLLKAETEGGE